jgi:hypothetical protein
MLDRLDTWIVGYARACVRTAVEDPGLDLYASFCGTPRNEDWPATRRERSPTLRLISGSDAEAWETYWRLLGEFRARAG